MAADLSPSVPHGVPPVGPPAAQALRRFNGLLGAVEELAFALSLGTLIGVSAYFAFATKVLHSTETWPYEVIRYMVFFVAMAGASLAAQRQGMFNMDLVTQRLGVRTRSALRIASGVVIAALCGIVVVAGFDMRAGVATIQHDEEVISESAAMLGVVVGFGLIGLHVLLHAAIEALHWLAGVAPPEPPRGGHG